MSPEPTNPQDPQLPATRPSAPVENIRMGMDTIQGMEALQRAGNMLSASTLIPETYRRFTVNRDGERLDNPAGLANCVIALNMALRMGADPLMVMQNMHVIEGRPSWSSMFVIASINQCGRFSPLRFDLSAVGEEVSVSYSYVEWEVPAGPPAGSKRRPVDKQGSMKIKPQSCRAWVIEKATGQRLEGPEITMQLAIDEGWIQKKGSKWRTMPEIMLRYRAASMFGKLYAPELLMGLQSREELEDIIEGEILEPEPRRVSSPEPHGAPKVVTPAGWSVASMEEFDGLMEESYKAFKDAGYAAEYQAFADGWNAKRGRSEATATIADLRLTMASLVAAQPAAADAAATPVTAEPTNGKAAPVRRNMDDKIRPQESL